MARRKRGGHGGHHGGAWKVAYADFVTSMMALFLILWLINMIPVEKRSELAEFFRDPMSLQGTSAGGKGILGSGANEGELTFEPMPLIKSREEYKNVLESILEERMPEYMDQVELRATPEGVEISLIEHQAQVLFPLGSSEPIPRSRAILAEVAKLLKSLPNDLVIGGHTDARPYQGDGSNWTLSANRADRVRQLLEQNGFPADRIAGVRGYADRELFDPKHPYAEENRRITLLLKPHKDEGKINLGPRPIGAPIGKPVTGPTQGAPVMPAPAKTEPHSGTPEPDFSPDFTAP
jgi:chemotaxis protein MotB